MDAEGGLAIAGLLPRIYTNFGIVTSACNIHTRITYGMECHDDRWIHAHRDWIRLKTIPWHLDSSTTGLYPCLKQKDISLFASMRMTSAGIWERMDDTRVCGWTMDDCQQLGLGDMGALEKGLCDYLVIFICFSGALCRPVARRRISPAGVKYSMLRLQAISQVKQK